MVNKNDILCLIDQVINDTRVRATLFLTKIWDPQLGNRRGTLLKQADQNRTFKKRPKNDKKNTRKLESVKMNNSKIGLRNDPTWPI